MSILSSIIAHVRSLMVVVRVRLSNVPASKLRALVGYPFSNFLRMRWVFDKVTDGPVSRH